MSDQPTPSSSAASALERADCLLCGTPAPAAPAYSFPPYGVVRCPHCGLFYLSPRLDEAEMVAAYREASYFEGEAGHGYSGYLAQEATLRRTFRRLLRAMARRGMTGGRLLEIGCAYGFFLEEAKPFFPYRAGTEYSEAGAARARVRAEAVYVGGLEVVPSGDEHPAFDVVVLIHTIEHVYDPVALLAQALARLAPGGWIVLATPDMGGFWRRLLGRRWPFFKAPEHVALYDAESLAALLARAGAVSVQSLPYVSYFPLSLVGEKLALKDAVPGTRADDRGWWSRLAVWVPATTVAAAGRKPPAAAG